MFDSSRHLRIGFLGAGFNKTHVQRLKQLGGVQFGAVCTTKLDSAGKLATECGPDTRAFDNLDRMLREVPLDVLYVALPPSSHGGEVETAAARGLHLMLEKPIALTLARAQSQVAAIEKAGVVAQMGYHMRFGEPVRRLRQMLADGSAGRSTLFDGAFLANALHGAWWRDVTRSGGQVVEQVIHLYDLAMHLLGKPVRVSAHVSNLCHEEVEGYSGDDTSASLINFENGAVASLVGSNCAVPMQWKSEFRVICRNVTAEFATINKATFTHSKGQPAEHYWQTRTEPAVETIDSKCDPYLEENRHFLATIRGEAQPVATAREGLESLRLVLAVAESARQGGRPVDLM